MSEKEAKDRNMVLSQQLSSLQSELDLTARNLSQAQSDLSSS